MSESTTFKNFFYIENRILEILGMLSTEKSPVWYKIYSFTVVSFFIVLFPMLVIKDLVVLDFNNALSSWFTCLAYCGIIPLSLSYYFHRSTVTDLLQSLERQPFIPRAEKLDDVVRLIIQKWYRLKNIKAVLFISAIVTSVGAQTIYSLVLRLTKTDPHDWKLGYGDLLNITYSPNFEIVYTYESIAVVYSTLITSTVIVIATGMLDYVAIQFKILQHNLRTLLSNVKKSLPQNVLDNSNISWDVLCEEIKNCVIYHIHIIDLMKNIEELFSKGIMCLFISILSMVCVDIYRASLFSLQDLRSYRIFIEATSVSIALFIISKSGENMAHESAQIANAIYEIDFVGTDVRFQKCLVILMRQSQKTVRIKAGKLIDISLITFAQILKTSYSVYAMLKTTNENEI